MKVFTSALVSSLVICHSDAFSVTTINHQPKAAPPCAPLAAKMSNNLMRDFAKGAGIFSAAVAIGWGATSPANAVEILSERQAFSSAESSSVALSLGEFADFSMPSYKDATLAAPMTDLKGERMIKTSFDTSATDTSTDKKPLDAAEEAKQAEAKKAAAAEKKIQQKAAREKQKADAEAAAGK